MIMTESVNEWQIGYWLCLDSNIAPGDKWLLFNLELSPVHTDCDNGNDNGRMGYIGVYGSVHMETCGKGNINP